MILRTTEKRTKKKSFLVKYDKYQDYGHIFDKCINLFRVVIIDGVLAAALESNSTILLVASHVVTEFSDVPNESQDKPPPICDIQPEIEPYSDEFTYHPYIDADVDVDIDDDFTDDQGEEALDNNIVEYSTLIFPKVTPMITEIIGVSPKDSILIPL